MVKLVIDRGRKIRGFTVLWSWVLDVSVVESIKLSGGEILGVKCLELRLVSLVGVRLCRIYKLC